MVHLYTDGSVYLNHGGIEMGQGTHTKIAQVVANSLGLPYEKIKISIDKYHEKVPNTSASAASSTTDLNAAAALNATSKIKKKI